MERSLIKAIIAFFLITGLVALAYVTYQVNSLFTKPLLVDGSQPALIQIKPNSSAVSFVNTLFDLHLIQSRKPFLSLIRYQGYTNRLKAGIYQLQPGESAEDLLVKVVEGRVLVEVFRIIEGTTLSQVAENLTKAPYLSFDPQDVKIIIGMYKSAEGLLLADTYHYNAGDNAKSLLKAANKSLLDYLDYSWKNRSPGLPWQSPYEMLIAASILEKESALPAERKVIAGVIVNRIRQHMPLQMDPTVIYALGSNYKGKLAHDDLSVHSDFNTYKHKGLPPTPIAMVGKASIDAAAHPQQSNYLYFVAKGDGSHEFSENYNQQKKAVMRYKYLIQKKEL